MNFRYFVYTCVDARRLIVRPSLPTRSIWAWSVDELILKLSLILGETKRSFSELRVKLLVTFQVVRLVNRTLNDHLRIVSWVARGISQVKVLHWLRGKVLNLGLDIINDRLTAKRGIVIQVLNVLVNLFRSVSVLYHWSVHLLDVFLGQVLAFIGCYCDLWNLLIELSIYLVEELIFLNVLIAFPYVDVSSCFGAIVNYNCLFLAIFA